MAAHESPSLTRFVSVRLDAEAEAITDRWLGHLSDELGVGSSRLVSTRAFRDHIPEVIRGVAELIRLPTGRVRSDVIGRLRLHSQLRREKGYDIQRILTEFEELSRMIFTAFAVIVRSYPGVADPGEVAEIAGHLRAGVMEITSSAVGMYRQEEQEQQRELARRLGEFSRAISHELKNPLGAAKAGAYVLREESVATSDEERDHFVELILRNLTRVTDLIDDVRTLALAEDAESTERWLRLDSVVETVFEEVRDLAQSKSVQLRVEGALPNIKVDAARIEITLVNLVSNAIKYSDPGKKERWVTVGAERFEEDGARADGWTIRVADNGLGIPKELHDNVFQRHFRAHPEIAEGTGLGLAITREVVTQRGGGIWFESQMGEGTTFYVVIPERLAKPEKRGANEQP